MPTLVRMSSNEAEFRFDVLVQSLGKPYMVANWWILTLLVLFTLGRIKWLKHEDINSKFFHGTLARRSTPQKPLS